MQVNYSIFAAGVAVKSLHSCYLTEQLPPIAFTSLPLNASALLSPQQASFPPSLSPPEALPSALQLLSLPPLPFNG